MTSWILAQPRVYLILLNSATLLMLAFAIPLGRAFLKGIESARDPMHRMTPQSPWFFFWREFRRRVWLPGLLFGIFVVLASAAQDMVEFQSDPSRFASWSAEQRRAWRLYRILEHPAIFLGLCATTTTSYFILAPRCPRLWVLVVLGFPVGFIFYVLLQQVVPLLTPWLPVYSVGEAGQWQNTFTFAPIFVTGLHLLMMLAAWLWVRSKGERWFRFDA